MTQSPLITFTYEKINTKEHVSNPSGIGEEAAGFEPAVAINHFSFQDWRLKPLGQTSKKKYFYFLNSNLPSASATIMASI